MFFYVQIGHEPNCLSSRPLVRRAILVVAGSNQNEIKMDALAACHVDDLDVQRQFVDVFTEYLNTNSRDASESESEGDDDNVGEDEDGDFGGVGAWKHGTLPRWTPIQ